MFLTLRNIIRKAGMSWTLGCVILWSSPLISRASTRLPFQYDWYDLLRPYLDERNATAVGVVGTCWGSYLVTHAAAEDPVVKAGFSIHPSHVALMASLDEDETAIYEGIQERGSAQYFGNTPSETNNTAAGGLADSIIDKVFEKSYPPNILLLQFYLITT